MNWIFTLTAAFYNLVQLGNLTAQFLLDPPRTPGR